MSFESNCCINLAWFDIVYLCLKESRIFIFAISVSRIFIFNVNLFKSEVLKVVVEFDIIYFEIIYLGIKGIFVFIFLVS